MFEKKESFWKKKGFYLSMCTALICVLAVGTVYYKMEYEENAGGKNLFADTATASPDALKEKNAQSSKKGKALAVNKSKDQSVKDKIAGNKKGQLSDKNKVNKLINNKKKIEKKQTKNEKKNVAKSQNSVAAMSNGYQKNFNEKKGLSWPVKGDVILKYSANNTVYFKTLAQYKCNPAIVISASAGDSVKAAADGVVAEISKADDIGNIVTVDVGSGYTVTYGQLEGISVKKGQAVKEGDVIASVAEPTKYFSEEGSNLYFQVKENGNTVDPMLLLK